jgi:hypothetical protein
MKYIKKFENNFNYDFGGHAFVLAKYKDGWKNLKFGYPFKNNEYVPCMVTGTPTNSYDKRDIYIIGSNHSFNIDDFDIIYNSDKGFEELIKMYSNTKKYNL